MSRSFNLKLAVLLQLSMSACSSLPKDAPNEFVDAKSSIDTMDRDKVKKKLPQTVDRAHDKFKGAVEELKNARKENEPEAGAIQQARESKEIADNAVEMNNNVKNWDEDQDKLNAALRDMKNGGAVATTVQTDTPFAKLKDKDIVNTVAYFKTDDAAEPLYNKKQLDSIASVLKADKSFHVVLVGHADKRGSESYNENLALERAKTIATALQQQGIEQDQIVYRSAGYTEAMYPNDSQALMQLDRSVEAVVNLR